MTEQSPEHPPGGAFYKPSAYAPVVGWPVERSDISEAGGPAPTCVECGYCFDRAGNENELRCFLCREKPHWTGSVELDRWDFQPTDFAYCPECNKPFLHNDMFPENGDESGVFACEPCTKAKIQSGEWRLCEDCGYCYERDIECPHSAEEEVEGDPSDPSDPDDSDEPGGPDDPREQCVRCDASLLPGQLDGFGHCPDCREEVEGEDE